MPLTLCFTLIAIFLFAKAPDATATPLNTGERPIYIISSHISTNDSIRMLQDSCQYNGVELTVLDNYDLEQARCQTVACLLQQKGLHSSDSLIIFVTGSALVIRNSTSISERIQQLIPSGECRIIFEAGEVNNENTALWHEAGTHRGWAAYYSVVAEAPIDDLRRSISPAETFYILSKSCSQRIGGLDVVIDKTHQMFGRSSGQTPRQLLPAILRAETLYEQLQLQLTTNTYLFSRGLYYPPDPEGMEPALVIVFLYWPTSNTPFEAEIFSAIEVLSFPKQHILLRMYIRHNSRPPATLDKMRSLFAKVEVLTFHSEEEVVKAFVNAPTTVPSEVTHFLWWDASGALLTDPDSLDHLIGIDGGIVAPLLNSPTRELVNCWWNISTDLEEPQTMAIWPRQVELSAMEVPGIWRAVHVNSLYLVKREVLTDSDFRLSKVVSSTLDAGINPSDAFSMAVRKIGHFMMFVDSRFDYGVLLPKLDTDSPDILLVHRYYTPMRQRLPVFLTRNDTGGVEAVAWNNWQQRYLNARRLQNTSLVPVCGEQSGVFVLSGLFSDKFLEDVNRAWALTPGSKPADRVSSALELGLLGPWTMAAQNASIYEIFASKILKISDAAAIQELAIEPIMLHVVRNSDNASEHTVSLKKRLLYGASLHAVLAPSSDTMTQSGVEVLVPTAEGSLCRITLLVGEVALFSTLAMVTQRGCHQYLFRKRDFAEQQQALQMGYIVFPFFHCGRERPAADRITVATHSSLSRRRMQEKVALVKGLSDMSHYHVSLALTAALGQSHLVLDELDKWFAMQELQSNMDIHLVVDLVSYLRRGYNRNVGRTIAMAYAPTEFLLHIDGDVLVPHGTAVLLPQLVPQVVNPAGDDRNFSSVIGFLVYSLKTLDITSPTSWPQTFDEVHALVNRNRAQLYFGNKAYVAPEQRVQGSTRTLPFAYREHLETYFLSRNEPALPPYRVEFAGRNRDRISQMWEMLAMGFELRVATGGFFICLDQPHSDVWVDYKDGLLNIKRFDVMRDKITHSLVNATKTRPLQPAELLSLGVAQYWGGQIWSGYLTFQEMLFHPNSTSKDRARAWYGLGLQEDILGEEFEEDAIDSWWASVLLWPERALEPMLSLAYRAIKKSDYEACEIFARAAAKLPLPPSEEILPARHMIDWGLEYILCICSPDKHQAIEACERVVEKSNITYELEHDESIAQLQMLRDES